MHISGILELLKTGTIAKTERNPFQLSVFVLKMLIILIIFKSVSIGLIFLLDWLDVFTMPVNINRLRFETISSTETLMYTSVFAPILEELSFRLPLRFSKWNLVVAVMGLSFIFSRVGFELGWMTSFFIALVIAVLVLSWATYKKLQRMRLFWLNHKRLVFYSLLLTFSFLHLKNYNITLELLLFSPIIILPRFLGGLLFSYLRLSSGIFLAICFHAFNNGIVRIISMLN